IPAGGGVGKQVACVLAEGGHALPWGSLRQSLLTQQRVHARLQPGQLLESHLVHLCRIEGCGGARAQCPRVVPIPIGQPPDAAFGFGKWPLALELRELAVQGRGDLVGYDLQRPGTVVLPEARRAPREAGDNAPLSEWNPPGGVELADRLIED